VSHLLAYAGYVSRGERHYTLQELAAEAGLPARTIRFYIARGLLPGPDKAGRGAAYTEAHLARLQQIKNLQARGLMLAEIAHQLRGEKPQAALPLPSAWWSYTVAPDVMVWVRSGLSPWRTRTVRAAVAELAARLQQTDAQEEETDGNG
jgi:DNA-binding transcriptional MerR regulator